MSMAADCEATTRNTPSDRLENIFQRLDRSIQAAHNVESKLFGFPPPTIEPGRETMKDSPGSVSDHLSRLEQQIEGACDLLQSLDARL